MRMNKQLLDPLGTMCKLIALNFNKTNTKISIHNHILTLHKPESYQFVVRMINGDGKENISELYYVIIRIINWYLLPQNDPKNSDMFGYSSNFSAEDEFNEYKFRDVDDSDTQENNIIDEKNLQDIDDDSSNETVFENGFEALKNEDYKSESIYFKNNINEKESDIIDDSSSKVDQTNSYQISQSKELRKMVKYLCNAFEKLQNTYEFGNVVFTLQYFMDLLENGINGVFDKNRLPKCIKSKEKQFETLLDYNKLKNMWDLKKIKRICELYDLCFQVYEDKDTPENKKDALIEGYLRSIDAMLDITDQEFQKLIQNSNNG